MARIKSAIKKAKQIQTKTMRNKAIKSQVQTAMKKFKALINANDPVAAEAKLPEVFSVIDTAVAKGVVHKNNAARKKAALSTLLGDLKSGKLVIAVKTDAKTKAAEKRAREAELKAATIKLNEENKAKKLAEKEAAIKAAKAKPTKKDAEEKPAKVKSTKAKTEEPKSEE